MSHFPSLLAAGFRSIRHSSCLIHDTALSLYINVPFESLYRCKLHKDYVASELAMYQDSGK